MVDNTQTDLRNSSTVTSTWMISSVVSHHVFDNASNHSPSRVKLDPMLSEADNGIDLESKKHCNDVFNRYLIKHL